jgi:N-acyl-D-aspartate/D-glutamate deacylase
VDCDVLITGGRLVDGTGNPWRRADVAVRRDRVVAIAPPGRIPPDNAREVVPLAGMVVCPGFIDIQSHSIGPLLQDGRSLSKVSQGVTSEIMGELWTPAPFGGRRQQPFPWSQVSAEDVERARTWHRFGDWLEHLVGRGVSVNVGSYLGGGTLREYACGWEAGDPTLDQLDVMRRVTAEAMEDGAFGVASALIYPPNSFSPDFELTEVARVAGRYGGHYITHLRSESDEFLEALEAAIRLGQEADVPVEVYHLKATGTRNWHKIPQAIARVDAARVAGVDIAADMYPYAFSGTGLNVLLPHWVSEGGRVLELLREPGLRSRAVREMLDTPGLSATDPHKRPYVYPLGLKLPENRGYIGRSLSEIASERGQTWPDTVVDLLLAEQQRISTVYFVMSEENLKLQLQQPWIKISTDAGGLDPAVQDNPVHPRAYGTFPRVLGKYVREEQVLSLESAVRKMTSAVAGRLGLTDRGMVREGAYADLVVFDPVCIRDRATFTDPHRLSVGVRDVWVNGVRVLHDGCHTGELPGRPIYGAGRR